ncbi:GNAT family N-acetyltransferase [Halovivax cerinus]|uniref:Enhanced intracellular survival protein Eis n=1 Tax=Halovivax cerinus TaxID=1487865 RepID=A0ABD5NKM9_9EURY|nr:GNAT family N-acetyltransferase [Halovivax cerinus]
MIEYRPLGENHREAFSEYVSYGFTPESGPVDFDPDEDDPERMQLGARRGLFDTETADDDPLVVCLHHWFDALVRGDHHPSPGLSMVASPPEHRRKGYIEDLLARSLSEYRDRGDRFSLLWPFRYRFYRQFGWETASSRHAYTCEPSVLSFARDRLDEPGEFRSVDADEYELLAGVYDAMAERYALSIDRSDDWWTHRIFTGWDEDPYAYVWEHDGEVRGYLVYFIEGSWGDRSMRVRDLAFRDTEALLALCAYLANHDSQIAELSFTLPTDVPLRDLATDPDELDCELSNGPMARLVDAVETLPALSFPAVDAEVTIDIEDPLVDWHDDPIRLVVEDGTSTCDRVRGADPDLAIDVGTLSQVVVGYRMASDLERLDAPDDVVATLDRLFPRDQTYVDTGF